MPEPDLVELFVRPLETLRVRYLISGSVASMLYGEPRITHDVDLIVFLRDTDVATLGEAFPAESFYVPPPEVIRVEIARERRGHFNLIHVPTGLKADCYTSGDDPLHAWALRRARSYDLGGLVIHVAPMEYVIVRKLEYFREGGSEKHLRDIRGMLRVSSALLDDDVLQAFLKERKLDAEWTIASGGH